MAFLVKVVPWQWWEHHLNILISLGIHYFRSAPLRSAPCLNHWYISQFQRSGAEHFWQWWEHHLNIAISLDIHYFSAAPLRSVPQSLVHFPVPTERSGTLLTMMGTPLEHCNFSRYSLFLRRSAPLLASIIGTFPSSNRAERNAFDNVPLMKNNLTEHCIMLHGSFIFPRSAPFRSVLRWCWLRYLNIVKCPWTFLISPLRSVLQWWWVTHLNIGICSLHFYYFPSPFRFASLLPLLLFRDILTHWQQIQNSNPKIKSSET